MKTLAIGAFLLINFLSYQAQASMCKKAEEILVSYPDDESFCYLSIPLENGEQSDPEKLWGQTKKAVDDLQQQLHNDKYKGSYKDLGKQLIKLYGNLDYAARVSGYNFNGIGRNFFESAILKVEGKKGLNAVNVKLSRIGHVDSALSRSLDSIQFQRQSSSCQGDYQNRLRKLVRKSIFKPAITGALTGTSATLATALYGMSLGPQYPLWLANLIGQEVYKLPFATIAPVAGWIGLGIGTATLIGYEGIILAKIIGTAKTLDLIRGAAQGKIKKSFASKLGNFAKGVAKTHGWSKKRFEAIIAQAITTMDSQGMPRTGLLESAPFEEGVQVCGAELPNRKDILHFLDQNPDYLVAQIMPDPVKNLLKDGSTTTHITYSDKFDPARRFKGVYQQIGRVQLDADWNEDGQITSARYINLVLKIHGATLPKDVVKSMKDSMATSDDNDGPKAISLVTTDLGSGPYAGGRSVTLGDASISKKQKDDGLKIVANEMEVSEKARQSYSDEENAIVLGYKVQITRPDGQTDNTWANCVEGHYQILSETENEIVMRHRKAVREQAEANQAKRTFAGKKLLWMTNIVRPDLNKWKRIVTIVDVDKQGQEEKTFSYQQCFPEAFQFPIFLSASTGNLKEEVELKFIRLE